MKTPYALSMNRIDRNLYVRMVAGVRRWGKCSLFFLIVSLAGLSLAACHYTKIPEPSSITSMQATSRNLPSFDSESSYFFEIVNTLTSPSMNGRGWGDPGLALAEDYLIEQVRDELALSPGMKDGQFAHPVAFQLPKQDEYTSQNIVASIPGRGALAGEAVMIVAHFDHLGRSDRSSRAPHDERWKKHWKHLDPKPMHPGADDNASGVATAIVATARLRLMLEDEPDHRTILLLLTTAEELGFVGVRAFAKQDQHAVVDLENTHAAINLDMVGRLGPEGLGIYQTQKWKPWRPAIVQAREGLDLKIFTNKQSPGYGDEIMFLRLDVPAILLNTGLHDDYHTPADTVDRLNIPGAVTIARFVSNLAYVLATP